MSCNILKYLFYYRSIIHHSIFELIYLFVYLFKFKILNWCISLLYIFIESAVEELPSSLQRPTDTTSLEPSPSAELQPPRFVEPLPSLEAADGEELMIPCKIVGKPPPQISFFHNGNNIDHNEEYVISYHPDTGEIVLLIVEVFPEDEGEYVCIAQNPAGEASTRAYLTVLETEVPREGVSDVEEYEVHPEEMRPAEDMEVSEEDLVPEVSWSKMKEENLWVIDSAKVWNNFEV